MHCAPGIRAPAVPRAAVKGSDRKRYSILLDARHVAQMLRFLVLAATTLLALGSPVAHPGAYWTLLILYALSVLIPILSCGRLRMRGGPVLFLLDIGALSALIILRGQEAPDLLVATFTLMLLAAVLEGVGNVLLNALVVSVAFIALTQWGAPPEKLITLDTTSKLALFFVTATLLGHTADEAREEAAARRNAEQGQKEAQRELRATNVTLSDREERLQKAEQSLRANERLYTIGMLSAGVSHELRNPIAAVAAGVETIQEIVEEVRGEGTAPSQASLAYLHDAGEACQIACAQLSRLVVGLNDLARAGEVRTSQVDVGTTLDIAQRLLRKAAGSTVEMRIAARATQLAQADPGRLLQVALNLGKNAIDALKEQGGGRLLLACEDAGAEHVLLVVEDNGPGVPADVRETLFEPFVTTKPPGQGTGLGLHLVMEIVTSHGGSVSCTDADGGGARFEVRLPACAPRQE